MPTPIHVHLTSTTLLLSLLLLTGCPDGGEDNGEGLSAGDVTAGEVSAGDVTATGPVTATGAISAGDVSGGAVAAGDVTAGDVVAGDVLAGDVAAGTVSAGAVTAGDVAAGDVAAGDVSATGAVTVTGPITAGTGLGIPVANVEIITVDCIVNQAGVPPTCGTASDDWTAAIQGACAGGTLASVEFAGAGAAASTSFWAGYRMLAVIECP